MQRLCASPVLWVPAKPKDFDFYGHEKAGIMSSHLPLNLVNQEQEIDWIYRQTHILIELTFHTSNFVFFLHTRPSHKTHWLKLHTMASRMWNAL